MTTLHFLQGKNQFAPRLLPDGTIEPARPFLRWESKAVNVERTDLDGVQKHVVNAMEQRWGLLRGHLANPLRQETVQSQIQYDYMDWLWLSFDNVPLGYHIQHPIGRDMLLDIGYEVLQKTWSTWSRVQSLVIAGPGFGLDPQRLDLHFWIPLSDPVGFPLLHQLLAYVNMESPQLLAGTRLGPTGAFAITPLDLHANEPTRVLPLAPPHFGKGKRRNPFASVENRVGILPGVPSYDAKQDFSLLHEDPTQRLQEHVRRMRLQAGRAHPMPTVRKTNVGGRTQTVVARPDRISLAVRDSSDPERLWIDVDGAPDHGWHILRSAPRLLRNLHGHPLISLPGAAPEFAEGLRDMVQQGEGRTRPKIVVDIASGEYHAFLWNESDCSWNAEAGITIIQRKVARDFLRAHGYLGRDLDISQGMVVYDPSRPSRSVVVSDGTFQLNRYVEPKVAPLPMEGTTLESLAEDCPTIETLLRHLLPDEVERISFVNWLAVIYQRRTQAGSGWIFPGVDGSGAMSLVRDVLTPVFGEGNVAIRRMNEVQRNDTDFLGHSLIVAFDEYANTTRSQNPWWTLQNLHTFVSRPDAHLQTPRGQLRKMPLHANFLLTTTEPDTFSLPANDRSFSVAPWQPATFAEAYPLISVMLKSVEDELSSFASHLQHWEIDTIHARTALLNTARMQLVAPGADLLDSYAEAIVKVDIGFFEPVFRMGRGDDMVMLAQQYAAELVWELQHEFNCLLNVQRLLTIYRVLLEPDTKHALSSFAKALYQRGIKRTTAINHRTGTTQSGILFFWKEGREVQEVYEQHQALIDTYYAESTSRGQ